MPRYLVEAYVPRSRARGIALRAREAAAELSREGTAVRYVRTTLLPRDETCFHVFEAGSAAAVEETARRAGLAHARVVRAVDQVSRSARPG